MVQTYTVPQVIHHTLHTTPQTIVERCKIWWPCCPQNWSLSTIPSIWICNVEVIPHISVKVRRWLNYCIPVALGHQNESEQIMIPIRSCCCNWVLRLSLTSQFISVAFYSEREKSDKLCSEVLISVWGSFTCRKSTTQDPRLCFASEGD